MLDIRHTKIIFIFNMAHKNVSSVQKFCGQNLGVVFFVLKNVETHYS